MVKVFTKVLKRNKADVGVGKKESSGYLYGTQNPSVYCTGPKYIDLYLLFIRDSDYNCLRLTMDIILMRVKH